MTSSSAVALVTLLGVVAMASGYVISPPIPVLSTTPGIVYNPAAVRPAVQLEVFIEVHSPDSRAAWPILKSVAAYYGADKLELIVQQLPLPYHRNAFLATQGLYVIRDVVPGKVFDYIEANLENFENFSTANTVDKSETEVLDMLANLAVTSTGIDKNIFLSSIGSKRPETIAVWKCAVKRSNAAVPVYFVNDVELGVGNNTPTFNDWIAFLDTIIT